MLYDNRNKVNTYNYNGTALLKDVRAVNNIWRYLKQDFLGGAFQLFKRQFYLKYDYMAIGYDSEEEFAYRLAGRLERVEPEYIGRLQALDIVKNPFVNHIFRTKRYTLDSARRKSMMTNNAISDAYNQDAQASKAIANNNQQALSAATEKHDSRTDNFALAANTSGSQSNTTDHFLEAGSQRDMAHATDKGNSAGVDRQAHDNSVYDYGVQGEEASADLVNQKITNTENVNHAMEANAESGRKINHITDKGNTGETTRNANTGSKSSFGNKASEGSSDNVSQTVGNKENISDTSSTAHKLNRFSDSPQDGDMVGGLMPIGWTGIAGAMGTESKHDHYPKAEALVPMPWNNGFVSTETLDNTATDTHTTSGEADNSKTDTRGNTASLETEQNIGLDRGLAVGEKAGESWNEKQAHDAEEKANEKVSHATGATSANDKTDERRNTAKQGSQESIKTDRGLIAKEQSAESWNENQAHGSRENSSENHRQNRLTASERGSSESTSEALVNDETVSATRDIAQGSSQNWGTVQNVARAQRQSYNDNYAVGVNINDSEQDMEQIGLQGVKVGDVWVDWHNSQGCRNVIGDLVQEVRPCFLLIL